VPREPTAGMTLTRAWAARAAAPSVCAARVVFVARAARAVRAAPTPAASAGTVTNATTSATKPRDRIPPALYRRLPMPAARPRYIYGLPGD
jgi:hypothetical protein